MKKNITVFLSALAFIISMLNFTWDEAFARKVICVDADPNDNGFLSNLEGWQRQNMKPGDTIIVGAPLDSCMKKVNNGDTLIIIAHGWGLGKGFVWGGTRYRGFGNGDSLHPVPPGFNNKTNVHVIFIGCWTARDPDGAGPDKPLIDKLKGVMGPPSNGNTVEGYTGRAIGSNCINYRYDSLKTDTGTINNFIRTGNQKWQKCPPVNRVPPDTPNQRTCLQALLDSVKGGAGKVTVGAITYKPPFNANTMVDTCYCNCNSDDHCGCTTTQIISEPFCNSNDYSWIVQTSGTTNRLFSTSAVSSKIGWAAGEGPTVIRTIDGGSTWISATGTGITGDVYNIYAVDEDIAFCTTSPGSTFIYKTINGGATWTTVFAQPGGFLDAIQMISPTEGYAVGDPVGGKWTILKTSDGGNSWFRMATEPVQVGSEAGWNNSFRIIGSHMWFGTNATKVYHSSDFGITWNIGVTSGNVNSYAVHYNNISEGLAGGNAMVKSINSGATYSSATNPAIFIGGLEGHASSWWATAFDQNIYLSTNHGTNWTIHHTQSSALFNAIDFATESGCAVGWAVGDSGSIAKMDAQPPSTLNLTAIIEGCWNGTINIGDTLKVSIRKNTSPYQEIGNAQGKNDASGNLSLNFYDVQIQNGNPYYIVISHRNSIQTWSKSGGEVWPGSLLSYDFTPAASSAFGNNLILKAGKYCIYSGDVNQDAIIDGADLSLIDNDAFNFVSGYVPTDLNYDDIVDGTDAAIADNNAYNFISVISP